MNYTEAINKFTKILFNPIIGWRRNNLDSLRFVNVISPFFIVTTLFLFLARFVGKSLKYLSTTDVLNIFLYSAVSFVADFLLFFTIVFAVNALLPYFHVKKSKTKVAVLIYLSLIPFYTALITLNLFPSLLFLGLVFLYGFYILYWGVFNYLEASKRDGTILFVLCALIIVGVYLIFNFLLIYPFFKFIF